MSLEASRNNRLPGDDEMALLSHFTRPVQRQEVPHWLQQLADLIHRRLLLPSAGHPCWLCILASIPSWLQDVHSNTYHDILGPASQAGRKRGGRRRLSSNIFVLREIFP